MTQETPNNITKTSYGYRLDWADFENYSSTIHVFESACKTDFLFHTKKDKSYFVNSGEFNFRWIDTDTGQIYQQNGKEGAVFSASRMVPCSLECVSQNGSLTESNNGGKDDDFIVIKKENIQ